MAFYMEPKETISARKFLVDMVLLFYSTKNNANP